MKRNARWILGGTAAMVFITVAANLSRSTVPDRVSAPLQIAVTPTQDARQPPPGERAAKPPQHIASASPSVSATHVAVLREQLARSGLRGAEPDGAVVLDANGQLQSDRALRRLFDWYLALSGEFPLSDIRTLLGADVSDSHGEVIAKDVLRLFDRYLDLQRATAAIDPALDGHARLDQLRALRRQWLGASADAMFGEEEADLARTLDRVALLSDPRLSDAERAALTTELDAILPDAERAMRADIAVASLADEQSRQFESLGTDAATRHEERADLFGDAAAVRLAALDAERAAWDARVSDYVRQRDMLRDGGVDPATYDAQLAQLRALSFAEHELRRVDALEAIGALPPGG